MLACSVVSETQPCQKLASTFLRSCALRNNCTLAALLMAETILFSLILCLCKCCVAILCFFSGWPVCCSHPSKAQLGHSPALHPPAPPTAIRERSKTGTAEAAARRGRGTGAASWRRVSAHYGHAAKQGAVCDAFAGSCDVTAAFPLCRASWVRNPSWVHGHGPPHHAGCRRIPSSPLLACRTAACLGSSAAPFQLRLTPDK